MNLLIPYMHSAWGGTELRYAVRGFCKHMKDMGELWIVGDCPEWLKPDVHIPMADNQDRRFKERNIKEKIERAIHEGIGSEFLFGNDDHFMTEDFEAQSYPYYYNAPLKGGGVGFYQQSVSNTITLLRGMGRDTLNYDIHCPIGYDGDVFLSVMGGADWRKPHGYVIKSLYSNAIDVEGKHMADMKICSQQPWHRLRKTIQGRSVFSIGDKSMGLPMRKLLEELYSEPSKYEKDI